MFLDKLKNAELSLSYDDILIKPAESSVLPTDVSVELALTDKIKLSVPVFSAAMDTVTGYEMARAMILNGACGPLHKNTSPQINVENLKKLRDEFGDNKPIAIAVGVANSHDEIKSFVEAGANILVVDCAHAHSENVGNLVKHISSTYPNIFLIAGNVVTADGAKYLIDRGAKAIKVGIGSGSICTTRKVTGIGRGQITSIADVADYCSKNNILVIADGGMRSTDEIMKAISCGANAVMLGYMLSGSDECPGEIVAVNGEKFKYYRGMGSAGVMKDGDKEEGPYNKHLLAACKWVAEGVESYVKPKGPVKDILHSIEWSLKSAFGYVGALNMKEVQSKTVLIRTTNSVLSRSNFHSVDKVITKV